jgi:hypothetical protein
MENGDNWGTFLWNIDSIPRVKLVHRY